MIMVICRHIWHLIGNWYNDAILTPCLVEYNIVALGEKQD